MDEIDIRVGLEQIAPHPLARMRLAGDEQHMQLVAHALDRDDRPVAVGRKLALDPGDLKFDDIGAGMLDRAP